MAQTSYSSTGEVNKSDTTIVAVPIDAIKNANVKLIEREYLIKVNERNDSIIKAYETIKANDDRYINYMKNYVNACAINNDALRKSLDKANKKHKWYVRVSTIVVAILGTLVIVK